MKSTFRKKLHGVILFLVLFSIIELPTGFFKSKISLILAPENSIVLSLTPFTEGYSTFCPDGSTPIIFEISAYNLNQDPIPFQLINVVLDGFQGTIKPIYPITDKDGKCIVRVYPKSIDLSSNSNGTFLETSASIAFSSKKSLLATYPINMAYPPVLLVHGFQDTSESMVPLKQYLEDNGFNVYSIDYSTETDINTMSDALKDKLSQIKADLKERGIYAQQVDIVAHSLGGLVARYYTSSQTFIDRRDVRKLIFINVPHHGTPWAVAGAAS